MEGAPHNAREDWEREQAARAAFGWFESAAQAANDEQAAKPAKRTAAPVEARQLSGDIAIDTDGELVPRYEFVGQRVEQLVSGDLMLEPRFGPVRITWVTAVDGDLASAPRLQLRWIDRTGVEAAALAIAADAPVVLRVPDRRDGAAIQLAIDRAHYFGTSLEHRGARLIAAHLQLGSASGLYSLAINGEILPATLEELAIAADSRRPYVSRWARALYAYCQQRHSRGPLSAPRSPKS